MAEENGGRDPDRTCDPFHVCFVPILLQKSAATDRAVMPLIKCRGLIRQP